MASLKFFKRVFDLLSSDRLRASLLGLGEMVNFRKDIIRMDLNDVCNIECIMCGNKPEKCSKDHYMTLEKFKYLMDILAPTIRFLYLSCSFEPLLTPSFISYVSYAKMKGIPFVSFATNGFLLNDSLIEQLISENINEIIISYNGYTKEDYDRIMFRSNHDVVIRNISNLVNQRKKKGLSLPDIRINTIFMKSNLKNIGVFIDFVKTHEIKSVQFRDMCVDKKHNNNLLEQENENLSNCAPDEYNKYIELFRDRLVEFSKAGIEVIIPSAFFEKGGVIGEKNKECRTSCVVPFFSYWINHQGDINVCCGEHESSHIGNILRDKWGEIKARRNSFRAIALKGTCAGSCKMNIYTSTMM